MYNCIYLKKAGLYFNEEQCDGDICLENNDRYDSGYDRKIVANDKLNINQLITFQSVALFQFSTEGAKVLTGP
jgi:hypothetical protein